MSLTWHILRKDVRRLRLPLAVWSLLQFAAAAMPAVLWFWTPSADALFSRLGAMAIVYFVLFLGTCDFAVRLIHEDAPADPRAFWITRPISGGRLLFTKIVTLASSCLLASIPSLLLQTIFFQNIGAITLQWLFGQALILCLAVILSSLTRTSRAFLLAGICLFAGEAAASLLSDRLCPRPPIYDVALIDTRLLVGTLLIALTGITVVAVQYFTRRTALGWFLLMAGLLATVAIPLWWHLPFSHRPSSDHNETASTVPIEVQIDSATLQADTLGSISRFNTRLHVSHIPSGHIATPVRADHSWENVGRVVYEQDGYIPTVPGLTDTIGNRLPSETHPVIQGIITKSAVHEILSQNPSPAYTGAFAFRLYRPEVVLELPIRIDAQAENAGHHVKIIGLAADGSALKILDIKPPAAAGRMEFPFSPFASNSTPDGGFAIVNRRTGEAFETVQYSSVTISLGGVSQLFLSVMTDAEDNQRTRNLFKDPDWLRDAVLVKIVMRPAGDFTRVLRQPGYVPTVVR